MTHRGPFQPRPFCDNDLKSSIEDLARALSGGGTLEPKQKLDP